MNKIHPNYFMFFILLLFVIVGAIFTIVTFVTTIEAGITITHAPKLLGWMEFTAPFQCIVALYIANGSLQLILSYFCLITIHDHTVELYFPFQFKTITIPSEAIREYNYGTLSLVAEKGFKTLLLRTRSDKWYELIYVFHFNLSFLEELLVKNKAKLNNQLKGNGWFKRTYSAVK